MTYSGFFSRRAGLIILHPLIITFILLSSYPVIHTVPIPFWYIILACFILASVFLIIQNWLGEKLLNYIIFFIDIPLIGVMIHFSGGVESIFPLLYILLIIVASLYIYRTGAYIISLVSVLFFLGLLLYEMKQTDLTMRFVMYRFYVFGLLFLFTGILSGAWSERYQQRTEEATRLRLTTEEILKNLPSGIMTIDNSGRIIYTNIPESTMRSKVHLYIARFLKAPHAKRPIELKIGKQYYLLSCARIYNSRIGLGILQDYTEIRKLEEKSRVSKQIKLLAELGGSLAHEIRNPLSSIRGSLEVIKESQSASDSLHFINMALNESIRLNEIVTDFLNFAQFVPLKKNRLRISEVINEAYLDAASRLKTKKVIINREDNDFTILGDLNKLKAGLVNIIDNACEATPQGKTVKIKTYKNNKEGFIEIEDSGKGISKQTLGKIFEPFYTTKKGGIGLGLAIAKNIIEAHGGHIEVTSQLRKGTVFRVILPRG
jgi:two-component system sensor histidine kinase PilS (NtrC family)